MKILVFGSCNIDLVYSVKSIVRPGETLAVGELNQFPGGKGFNQAIAAARAGAQTVFAGCIGSDGEFLRRMLNEAGPAACSPWRARRVRRRSKWTKKAKTPF